MPPALVAAINPTEELLCLIVDPRKFIASCGGLALAEARHDTIQMFDKFGKRIELHTERAKGCLIGLGRRAIHADRYSGRPL